MMAIHPAEGSLEIELCLSPEEPLLQSTRLEPDFKSSNAAWIRDGPVDVDGSAQQPGLSIVAQNAQGNVQDKQVEHLHQLGVTTHKLVVENTELTEAIHDHFIKNSVA